jgi:aspartate/methionine/tyrosine aminotransferase
MKFSQKNSIHLISDKVYALSVYDSESEGAVNFTYVLSIDKTDMIDPNLLHVFYGFSKIGARSKSGFEC